MLDRFEGTLFHSAQWDHDHDLTGERVAVLGTGASAVHFVPAIAPRTAGLTVYQRSAPYVQGKPDRAYRERAKQAFARVPGGARCRDVRRDVAEAFDAWVQERVGHTVFAGGCRSWYLTETGRNTQNWPASTLTFRRRLRRFRLAEFEPAPAAVPVGGSVGHDRAR